MIRIGPVRSTIEAGSASGARASPFVALRSGLLVFFLAAGLAPTRAFAESPPEADWREIASDRQMTVMAAFQENGIWLRVIGELSYPREDVCRVLSAVERYPDWYPGLVGTRLLEGSDRSDVPLLYGRFEPPWPFDDRDYVAEQHWQWIEDRLHLESRGVEHPQWPPEKDTVRLRNLFMQWRLTDLGERTGLELVYLEPVDSWYRSILARMLAAFARDLLANLDALGPGIAAAPSTPRCAAGPPPRSSGPPSSDPRPSWGGARRRDDETDRREMALEGIDRIQESHAMNGREERTR